MKIENTVEVDAPLDRVWALVNDIPRVAPCMPGAALTGVLDDGTPTRARSRSSSARCACPTRARSRSRTSTRPTTAPAWPPAARTPRAAGTARASVETRLEAAGDTRTRLQVTSDVQLTGKVASFGRGGAINDVAARLFGQFADCLRATLEAESASRRSRSSAAEPPPPVPTPPPPARRRPGRPHRPPSRTPAGAPPRPVEAVAPSATAGRGRRDDHRRRRRPAPTTASGDGHRRGRPAWPRHASDSQAGRTPPPRAAEALDAGSLAGTVIKGRLQALFQAIAGFCRRVPGGRPAS